jgi:Zn-dependent protease/CBS domain-containing protein
VTLAGTEVRVHITFLLLLVWIWFMHYRIGGTEAAWAGVLFILAVFLCVVLHEFGHIFAARCFGIRTPDVTLLPIGGLARLERMPEQPGQELVIAVAGPLVNVVIAAVLLAYTGGNVGFEHIEQIEDPRAGFLARLAAVNIFLVVFNMIPAFPMDGGRVLRGVLAFTMPWARATQIAATIGQGLAFVFGFVGLFYSPMLIFIAIFVYLAATVEAQDAQLRDVSSSLLVGDVMVTQFARLPETATIADAVDMLLATTQHEFPVVDSAGQLKGILLQGEMIRALRDEGRDAPVSGVMQAQVPTIHHRRPLEDALRLMRGGQTPVVTAVDTAGHPVGLVTRENIGEMMMVRAARPEVLFRKRGPLRRDV